MNRSGTSAADRIQFQMTLHEEDEENVDEKDQVGNRDPKWVWDLRSKQNKTSHCKRNLRNLILEGQ